VNGRRLGFACISVAGLLLTACGPRATGSPGASASGAPNVACDPGTESTATGGTLRIGIGGSSDSLNPGLGLLSEAYELYELVYDTTIAIDAAGEYIPELATEWSVADDGVTWTVTLRDDATFHDGEPITAEDVKFSIELWRDHEEWPYLSSYPDVFETVEATNETTVTIVTSEPVGNFESRMLFMYVIPQHIWEAVEDPTTFDNAEMIGSGPFQLVEFNQGEFAQLAAFEEYYAGRPNIDEVIFQTIENSDARVTALTTGEVDALGEFPVTAVPALRNAENVEVCVSDIAAGGALTDIIFNVVTPENCPADDPETPDTDETGTCNGHPALQEVEVRRALAMATDKEELIAVARQGLASPGLGLVPRGLGDYFASDLTDYPFDPAAASQMLEDAGYVDSDGDGIRECKADQDCDTLTLRLNYPTDSDSAPREAEVITSQWREVGVAVEAQGLDADTLTSVCCPAFDYDVILWGWGSDPDPQFLMGVLLCTEITTGFSESGYCNPEYDELYEQQGVETDPAARAELLHRMQEIALEDVPYIIPYYDQNIEAWRTDAFTGFPVDNPTLGITDPSSLRVVRPVE
jgi:peptide/nickel transport system substrate-binding protein